jgi:predicted RNA-binding protein YlxR (DUF448 family)
MTPVRTCIGCRKKDGPAGLLRMTVSADDGAGRIVVPDPGRRAPGRGAHLHPTTECFDQAVRRRAFTRALRVSVALSDAPLREHLARKTAKIDRHTTDRNWSSSS